VRVFRALTTLLASGILLCALLVDWRASMLFRAMSGFAISGSSLIIESWLNERVTNENRGSIFSVYLITTMVGTIGGQYLVPLGDPSNTSLFILCGIIFSVALLPTALTSSPLPAPPTQARFDVAKLYRRSPAAVVGAFLAGAMSGAWLNLGGVFTQRSGLSTAEGATLLACVLLGSALSQIPIGRASDRMDRRLVMVACGIHANDRAQPDEYVEVSSGMMIVYGVGTISGPIVVGPIMDRFGPGSLFVVLAAYFVLYGAYAAWRISRREENDGLVVKTDYQAMAVQPLGADVAAAALQPDMATDDRIEDTTTPEWR